MKKTIAMIIAASIAAACFCGCAQNKTGTDDKDRDTAMTSTPSGDDPITEDFDFPTEVEPYVDTSETEPILLDWTIPEDIEVTDELSDLFDRAMEDVVGASYSPVMFMGSAEGDANVYCFLCNTALTDYEEHPYWTIVYITEDTEGNASFDRVGVVDYGASYGAEGPVIIASNSAFLPGGWEATSDLAVNDDLLNVYIESVIDIGMGGVLDIEKVKPEAVIASQVVAGMNYCFLNHWLNESEGTYYWSLEFVYADLAGNGTMVSCCHLDIGEIYALL